MSRQSKQARVIAKARRFSALRKAGTRTHNALSRRRLSPEYQPKPHTMKVTAKVVKITHKH